MRLTEFDLIRELFAPLATSKAALDLKDDVALLKPGAGRVVTTDTIIEGVDFFASDPPETIARKALRVNLSDLAAKGAKPEAYLLTLALPKRITTAWLRAFARGLKQDQRAFGITLLGGDLSGTPGPLMITVTAFGAVAKGRAILRGGAKRGDLVFVSGTIGDGGGGLAALRAKKKREAFLIGRYRVPEPRVALGQKLRGIASAALDVSDGLLADLGHIAEVSEVHIAVDAARVPLSPALKRFWKGNVGRAATAGDDYEIAFTAPRAKRARVLAAAKAARTKVTEIGFVMQGRGVALLGPGGKPMKVEKKGWEHF
jgi:thiamine-monophosphate kinase